LVSYPSNLILCERKKIVMITKIKFTITVYIQICKTVCSQDKRISRSVLIVVDSVLIYVCDVYTTN
jgi:hypothetical protein